MKQIKKNYTDSDWLNDPRPVLKKRAEMLEKEIEARKQALLKAPEGKLRTIKYGKTFQYYIRTDGKDTHGDYIPKKNRKLASALAQKDYDKQLIGLASEELRAIYEYMDTTSMDEIGKICDNMHEGKRILVNPVYKDQATFVSAWEAVSYEPGYFLPGEKEHYTVKHERVRSKAEENIANMMAMYGIPYRYEFPMLLDNVERRPDFTCLNVRTRKEFIWEHFGMMDMEDYALKNVDKIGRYILNGYIPGENFIMTFETQNKPLHSGVIKAMIENYLI